jgi:hypothetical protein
MNGEAPMRKAYAVTSGLLAAAALTVAHADELRVSKLKYTQPLAARILVCPGTISPSDCNVQNALAMIVGPPSANEISCGVQSQALLAGTGMRMREGQYVEVTCARTTPQAD